MNDAPPRCNGETYFFRDHGQFDLLRLSLLPELIERRRDIGTLRLWSAGCSSGEEAYSLAILVDQLLPARAGWKIVILGSDINPLALARALRGRYGEWSFRMMPANLQQRYFHRHGDQWELDERIRDMVSFVGGDLIRDPYPRGDMRDMDLIVCRNVLIYFNPEAATVVADKLAASLVEDGYLMTGHTELMGHRMQHMHSRLLAESVVYQRRTTVPAEKPPPIRVATAAPVATRRAFRLPPPEASVAPAAPLKSPQNAESMLASAHEHADRGDYASAKQACHEALAVAPLAAAPYFLLAQLAQIEGAFERAGNFLNKTLYLDPDNVAATLELAALSERAEDFPRALKLRRNALEIVRALPDDALVEPYKTSAADMKQWLAQWAAAPGAPVH